MMKMALFSLSRNKNTGSVSLNFPDVFIIINKNNAIKKQVKQPLFIQLLETINFTFINDSLFLVALKCTLQNVTIIIYFYW